MGGGGWKGRGVVKHCSGDKTELRGLLHLVACAFSLLSTSEACREQLVVGLLGSADPATIVPVAVTHPPHITCMNTARWD